MLSDDNSPLVRLLRWSEKYTKTDMVYVFRGTSLSFLGQGIGLIASLLLAITVSHYIPKEVYGTYKFILSVVSILSLFSLTGIGSAVFQSAAQGFDGALHRGFWENIKWSVGVFAGGAAVAVYYFVNGNTTLAIGVLVGASLSPFIASASLFGPFLGGKKDFWRQTLYGVIDNVIPIFIFICVIFFTSNPVILILTYFVTNVLAALFFYARTIKVYAANLHLHDNDLLNYSKHLSVMGIISGTADNLDQILLFHFVGTTQLAVYNFATAIPDFAKGPMKNFDAMLQARFAQRNGLEIRDSIFNKALWYGVCAVLAVALYVIVAPFIFAILFPAYMDAVHYSQIYVVWLLTTIFDPFATYIWARRLKNEMYISTLTYSCVQIGGMLIGVLSGGLLGLIIARVVTRFSVAFLNFILYRRAIFREIHLL